MLSDEQISDLVDLHHVADQFGAEVTIIGAAALLCFVDLGRFTRDVDVVLALDLEDFSAFVSHLRARAWKRDAKTEHRWRGPGGSLVDMVPAGPKLRAAKRVIWTESQFEMSLAGFEHVFSRSSPVQFATGVQFMVAPPAVVALLKIVAYLDDRARRAKDLQDPKLLFRRYEASGDRIVS